MSSKENGGGVYAVSDLDGVWVSTPQEIIRYGNQVLGLNLSIKDYDIASESIASLWGFDSKEEASKAELERHWRTFCNVWMPRLSLMQGAVQTANVFVSLQKDFAAQGDKLIVDIWTSRRSEFADSTKPWVVQNLPFARDVVHTVDWSKPGATRTSKAEYLSRLPSRPRLYLEDEAKHAVPVAEAMPEMFVGLFDTRNRFCDLTLPPNVTRLTTHSLIAKFARDKLGGMLYPPEDAVHVR